jgi:hypothetical protein
MLAVLTHRLGFVLRIRWTRDLSFKAMRTVDLDGATLHVWRLGRWGYAALDTPIGHRLHVVASRNTATWRRLEWNAQFSCHAPV